MAALKIWELLPRNYTVTAFESIQSIYGQTYKISAIHESNENVVFCSELFLTN